MVKPVHILSPVHSTAQRGHRLHDHREEEDGEMEKVRNCYAKGNIWCYRLEVENDQMDT